MPFSCAPKAGGKSSSDTTYDAVSIDRHADCVKVVLVGGMCYSVGSLSTVEHVSMALCCDLQVGQLELVSRVTLPKAARKISVTFCPQMDASGPEYVAAGGEDTNVYIYDISRPSSKPTVVNQLQVSLHMQTQHSISHLAC